MLSGIEYETYQSLAASVRFALPAGDEPRLVLVTSALHAEGKSTVCARLGAALAQAGQRTLLVSAPTSAGRPCTSRSKARSRRA